MEASSCGIEIPGVWMSVSSNKGDNVQLSFYMFYIFYMMLLLWNSECVSSIQTALQSLSPIKEWNSGTNFSSGPGERTMQRKEDRRSYPSVLIPA